MKLIIGSVCKSDQYGRVENIPLGVFDDMELASPCIKEFKAKYSNYQHLINVVSVELNTPIRSAGQVTIL